MRTSILLDEALIKEAAALAGVRIKRELVGIALRELIRFRKTLNMFDMAGKIRIKSIKFDLSVEAKDNIVDVTLIFF